VRFLRAKNLSMFGWLGYWRGSKPSQYLLLTLLKVDVTVDIKKIGYFYYIEKHKPKYLNSREHIPWRNWIWSKRGRRSYSVDRRWIHWSFRTAVVESAEKDSRNYIIQALVNAHDASHIFEQCIQQKQKRLNCKKKKRYEDTIARYNPKET